MSTILQTNKQKAGLNHNPFKYSKVNTEARAIVYHFYIWEATK